MTSARIRRKRQSKPSAPRRIGANDNAPAIANDNENMIVGGITLNKKQTRRFRAAVADQASADFQSRVRGRDELAALEVEIAQAANQNAREEDAAETLHLEASRGSEAIIEMVSDKNEPGPARPRIRIRSRDGLETLLATASITRIQHSAGMRYRDDYEAIDPEKGLTPPSIDQTRNIVRGGDGYAQKRREIEERVFGIHCMICGIDAPTSKEDRRSLPNWPAGHPAMRAIHALNHIAGRGDNLGDMTKSGSVKARIREDLILALDGCAIVYGLE